MKISNVHFLIVTFLLSKGTISIVSKYAAPPKLELFEAGEALSMNNKASQMTIDNIKMFSDQNPTLILNSESKGLSNGALKTPSFQNRIYGFSNAELAKFLSKNNDISFTNEPRRKNLFSEEEVNQAKNNLIDDQELSKFLNRKPKGDNLNNNQLDEVREEKSFKGLFDDEDNNLPTFEPKGDLFDDGYDKLNNSTKEKEFKTFADNDEEYKGDRNEESFKSLFDYEEEKDSSNNKPNGGLFDNNEELKDIPENKPKRGLFDDDEEYKDFSKEKANKNNDVLKEKQNGGLFDDEVKLFASERIFRSRKPKAKFVSESQFSASKSQFSQPQRKILFSEIKIPYVPLEKPKLFTVPSKIPTTVFEKLDMIPLEQFLDGIDKETYHDVIFKDSEYKNSKGRASIIESPSRLFEQLDLFRTIL